MKPIISVENLGKSYRIRREAADAPTTFREVLTELPRKLLKGGPKTKTEEFWALDDVSFDIMPGERVGIIGRNGAGKSTLLKLLSRITEPTRGKIIMRGRAASLLEVGTGFHPELTGRENIYLNGAILGMSRAEVSKKFDEIVDFAGVEKFLDTPVKRYSSGMYVRLGFAVAAHLEPEILIVDEVLAVGDMEFQKKCLGKMEEVSTGEGRTVLFVSHNMGAIRNLCSNTFLLKDGKIVFAGNTEDAISEYEEMSVLSGGGATSGNLIKKIFIRDVKSGKNLSIATPGKPIQVDIHVVSEQQVLDFFLLAICDRNNSRVSSFHTGHQTQPVTLQGEGVVSCTLGPLFLASGKYSLTVAVGQNLPRKNFEYIENTVTFWAEDTGFFPTGESLLPGQGVWLVPSQWIKAEEY